LGFLGVLIGNFFSISSSPGLFRLAFDLLLEFEQAFGGWVRKFRQGEYGIHVVTLEELLLACGQESGCDNARSFTKVGRSRSNFPARQMFREE